MGSLQSGKRLSIRLNGTDYVVSSRLKPHMDHVLVIIHFGLMESVVMAMLNIP